MLKKDRAAARQLVPFRQKCVEPETTVLQPGESLYGTVLVSAGLNGWDVADPGRYTIQVAAHVADTDVVSQPLELRIAPPVSREDEYLAGDLFTQDPARTLVFGGTKRSAARTTCSPRSSSAPGRRIAIHARVALGGPLTIDYKQLAPKGDDLAFALAKAKPEEATTYLEPALVDHARTAADTFGHIRYRGIAERTAKRLAEAGAEADATKTIDSLIDTLATRTRRRPSGEGRGDRGAPGDPGGADLRRQAEGQGEGEDEGLAGVLLAQPALELGPHAEVVLDGVESAACVRADAHRARWHSS